MKKTTKKVLKWACNISIDFNYWNLKVESATVKIMDSKKQEIETIELNREQIADCICDWMIARAKGYDVD